MEISHEQESIINMLDYCFTKLRGDQYVRDNFPGVSVKADFGRTSTFTVVDVGCGQMPYAEGLWLWMFKKSSNPMLIGIDTEDQRPSFSDRPYVTFVQSEVEKARPLLQKLGVTSIDLLTVFNPNPMKPLPNPASLAFWSLLLVAYPNDSRLTSPLTNTFEWRKGLDNFWEGTDGEFEPLLTLENPYYAELQKSFHYSFSPILFALK